MRILLIFALIAPELSFGAPCRWEFGRIARLATSDILTEDEKNQIQEVFLSNQLLPVDRAFAIYAQARLRTVEPGILSKMTRYLSTRVRFESTKNSIFDAEYTTRSNALRLKVPDRYRQSPVVFITLVHEFEHMIQHNTLLHKHGSWRRVKKMKFANIIPQFFFLELGAMRAEWSAISALPKEVREKAAAQIQSDGELSKVYKELFLRWLGEPAPTMEAHIEKEWAANRYSKLEVKILNGMHKLLGIGVVGLGTVPVGTIGWEIRNYLLRYCADPKTQDDPERVTWCGEKQEPATPSDRGSNNSN